MAESCLAKKSIRFAEHFVGKKVRIVGRYGCIGWENESRSENNSDKNCETENGFEVVQYDEILSVDKFEIVHHVSVSFDNRRKFEYVQFEIVHHPLVPWFFSFRLYGEDLYLTQLYDGDCNEHNEGLDILTEAIESLEEDTNYVSYEELKSEEAGTIYTRIIMSPGPPSISQLFRLRPVTNHTKCSRFFIQSLNGSYWRCREDGTVSQVPKVLDDNIWTIKVIK